MKLKNIISIALAGGMLCSCSAIYEDLDPCPQGVNMRLSYTRNISGEDLYDAQVHCSKVLIYDVNNKCVGCYDVDGNTISAALAPGAYHAIAMGGMGCEESSFAFSHNVNADHNYTELTASLLGTRSIESASLLHPQFHGMTDFVVSADDLDYISQSIDLTKNTNHCRVVLDYSDGSAISNDDFEYTLLADNAVIDHANNIVKQGEEVIYRPHAFGGETRTDNYTTAWADFSIGRLQSDIEFKLIVKNKQTGKAVVSMDLMKYFDQIKQSDANTSSLQDYLDKQDTWIVSFTLEPDSERIAGLQFKINDWILNLANTGIGL